MTFMGGVCGALSVSFIALALVLVQFACPVVATIAAGGGGPRPLHAQGRVHLRRADVTSVTVMSLRGGLQEEGFDPLGDGSTMMVDVSGDGGVIKKITRPGREECGKPAVGDEAFVHFNGTVSHINANEMEWNGTRVGGRMFDSSLMQGRYPRAFRLDDSEAFPRGLEIGLLSMQKGERATLMVRSDYAYGTEGKQLHTGAFVPPNATLKYDLEMMRWNERDLLNDGGVLVRTRSANPPLGSSLRHPEGLDEVLCSFSAECKGVIFDETEGMQWIHMGSGRLPEGMELAIVREGVKGGTIDVDIAPEYAFGEKGRQGVGCNQTVRYTMTVHDWNTVRDVNDDGSLVVKQMGQPDDMYTVTCKDGSKVDFTIVGMTRGKGDAEGDIFLHNSSFTNVSVGGRTLPEAVENAMAFIRQGQEAHVLVRAQLTKEEAGLGRFPYEEMLKQDTVWKIMVSDMRKMYQLTPDEKAEAARVRKDWGNELFNRGMVAEAMDKYEKAFQCVQFQKDHAECGELKFTLHLNKAACVQKMATGLDDWRQVVTECTNALEMKSHNTKALFRRGVALMNLHEIEGARNDLRRVVDLDVNNAAAKARLAQISEMQRAEDEKSKGVYSKMFSKPLAGDYANRPTAPLPPKDVQKLAEGDVREAVASKGGEGDATTSPTEEQSEAQAEAVSAGAGTKPAFLRSGRGQVAEGKFGGWKHDKKSASKKSTRPAVPPSKAEKLASAMRAEIDKAKTAVGGAMVGARRVLEEAYEGALRYAKAAGGKAVVYSKPLRSKQGAAAVAGVVSALLMGALMPNLRHPHGSKAPTFWRVEREEGEEGGAAEKEEGDAPAQSGGTGATDSVPSRGSGVGEPPKPIGDNRPIQLRAHPRNTQPRTLAELEQLTGSGVAVGE